MCGRLVTDNSFNFAPTQTLPVRTQAGNTVEATWGISMPKLVINARDDTESARFKSLRETSRCLIKANGYYEWTKDKTPYYITTEEPFLIGGLLDKNNHFVLMTTSASEAIKEIHHRMPVIIKKDKVEEWLSLKRWESVEYLAIPTQSGFNF